MFVAAMFFEAKLAPVTFAEVTLAEVTFAAVTFAATAYPFGPGSGSSFSIVSSHSIPCKAAEVVPQLHPQLRCQSQPHLSWVAP